MICYRNKRKKYWLKPVKKKEKNMYFIKNENRNLLFNNGKIKKKFLNGRKTFRFKPEAITAESSIELIVKITWRDRR